MRKLIRQHEAKKQVGSTKRPEHGAEPNYLLDRDQQTSGTVLSSMIKQKRKQKAVCFKKNNKNKKAICSGPISN